MQVEGKPPGSADACMGNGTAKGSQRGLLKTGCRGISGKALLGSTWLVQRRETLFFLH